MEPQHLSARNQIEALAALDNIKVWSLIATIFGDLTKGDLTSLSGRQIRQITGPMGVKPEALRVALHRLRKDKWIETRKAGRETLYSLTPDAMRETVRVHDDVYREGSKYRSEWWLQIQPCEGETANAGFGISPDTFLVPSELLKQSVQTITVPVDLTTLPAWVDERIVPVSSREAAALLADTLPDGRARSKIASDLENSIARILVVHHWRKLALRRTTWFHIARYPSGSLARCQENVCSFFARHEPLQARFFD